MSKIGVLAGGGELPLEFISSAKKKGETVVVFAIKDVASPDVIKEADKVHWLNFGQYAKFALLLVAEQVKRLALLGKVKKESVYKDITDKERSDFFKDVANRKDYTLLKKFTHYLQKLGTEVIDPSAYLDHLAPQAGTITASCADEDLRMNIQFGYDIAKKVAGMDIGQTVIIKDMTVVAVEAMEGTDAAIERGRTIAGDGCVMIKVSRPNQDMRWDIPTVGPRTMEKLAENNYKALVIESGRMFMLHKDEMVRMADAAGIIINVI